MAVTSIVDYLNSGGQDSSYAARKKLASTMGISNYSGTAAQNNQLLKALQSQANNTSIQDANNQYAPVVQYGSNTYDNSSSDFDKEMSLDDYYNQYFDEDNAPSYSSKYSGQIDNILNTILNRQAFDVTTDANYNQLYNTYKEGYTNQARKGMADSMASAQAATGGYGNSYAASVGQQTYDDYMSQLNDQNINLMNLAYGMYQDDIADNYNKLNAVTTLDNMDYSRYRDDVSDFMTNRDYYTNRYDTRYQNAQNEDADALSAAMSLAQQGITVPQKYAMYLDDDTVNQLNTLAADSLKNRYKTTGGSDSGNGSEQDDYYDKLYRIEQGAVALKEQQKSLTDSQKYNYYKAIRSAGYSDEEAADVYKELGIGENLLKKFKNGNK